MNQDPRTTAAGDSPEEREIASRYAALARAEPPAALDAAILAAAHRAVGARPQTAGSAAPWRWQRPLAWAAVVVLTASIGLAIFEDYPQQVHVPQASLPSLEGAAPSMPSGTAPANEQPGAQSGAPRDESGGERPGEMAQPQPPQALADQPAQATRERSAIDQSGRASPPAPAPAPAPVSPAMREGETPAPAGPAGRATAEVQDGGTSSARLPAAPRTAPLPSRFASPAKPESTTGVTRQEHGAAETSQPDQAKLSNEAAQDASAVVPSQARQGVASGAALVDPRQKLAVIEALIREGKRAEARRALVDLQQQFPEFPVPDEIRKQLD